MPRSRSRKRGRSSGGLSRRSLVSLGIIGIGGLGVVSGSAAYSHVTGQRPFDIGSSPDESALLGLDVKQPSGQDGNTVPLLSITNNFNEVIDSISVSVIGAGGGIGVSEIALPYALDPDEKADVTGTIHCDEDVEKAPVDLQIVAEGAGESIELTRTVYVDCTGVVAPVVAVDLIAGQHCIAGEVRIENDSSEVTITYDTGGRSWGLTETHLAASNHRPSEAPGGNVDNEWLDERWQTPSGNPVPGRFPYDSTHDTATHEVSHSIPLDDITDGVSSGDAVFIGAHGVVERSEDDPDDECGTEETAWGEGDPFDADGGWAMYIEYEIQ